MCFLFRGGMDTHGESSVYGAVEAPAGVDLAVDQAAPVRSSRAAKLACGLLVTGVAVVSASKVYNAGIETAATPVLAAQAPAAKKDDVGATESASGLEAVQSMSSQREALRDSLIQVGTESKIIFGHENSNREGQHFWDNAGMDMHSDVFNTTGQYPGMYGYSFQDIIDGSKMTNHVLNAARQNAVIEFFWEANNPVNNGSARDDTGYPCKALLPGGDANDVWNGWMDIIIDVRIGLTRTYLYPFATANSVELRLSDADYAPCDLCHHKRCESHLTPTST